MSFKVQFVGKFTLNKKLTTEQYEKILQFLDDNDNNWCSLIHCNEPLVIQPSDETSKLDRCCWDINLDKETVEWDKYEELENYDHVQWLQILIDKFFKPWELTLSGEVKYRGRKWDDLGTISVTNNCITYVQTISELEKYISYLEEHIKCSPDGELALAAKEHFVTLLS